MGDVRMGDVYLLLESQPWVYEYLLGEEEPRMNTNIHKS